MCCLAVGGMVLDFAYRSVRISHVTLRTANSERESEESEALLADKRGDTGDTTEQREALIAEFVPGFNWDEFDDAAAELKVMHVLQVICEQHFL